MFLEIRNQSFIERKYNQLNHNNLTIGFITIDEFLNIYKKLGFDEETIDQCQLKSNTFQTAVSVYSTYYFGIMHILDLDHLNHTHTRFAFYITKYLLLIVDLSPHHPMLRSYFDTICERSIQVNSISLSHLIICVLTTFLTKDNQILEQFELLLESLESKVMVCNLQSLRLDIFTNRRKLLMLHNYYEQFLNVITELSDNTINLFDPSQIHCFLRLEARVSRLSQRVHDLSNYLSDIKDSYMTQLDLNLNNTMKVFTIVTSIFLPLTLIVGWYGMNFKYMPELHWKYGYVWVITLCILVLIICFVLFRKKHLL